MNRIRLFVIDPQNDFMDIADAALPVPGANADMVRLAGFIQTMTSSIDDLVVTLDSHSSVGVERTTFWMHGDGAAVSPFTKIKAVDVEDSTYLPRNKSLKPQVIEYLRSLEAGGERTLIVWPVHCVLGTWGHNLQGLLAQSIADWEYATGRTCEKVLKGLNTMTEQYSAFRAEVPSADDPRTQNNSVLMARLQQGSNWLVVGGEALIDRGDRGAAANLGRERGAGIVGEQAVQVGAHGRLLRVLVLRSAATSSTKRRRSSRSSSRISARLQP